MKKLITLLTIASFIQCGSSGKKSVSEIIAQGTLEEIQLEKTTHVKTINQLQKELDLLDSKSPRK